MLNFTAGTGGMQAACSAACIRTVVTSRTFLEQGKLTDKVAALSGIQLLYLEDMKAALSLADKLWLIFWALRFPRQAAASHSPEDPAVVLFTSGSKHAKGVCISHRAISPILPDQGGCRFLGR
jgi:acyl-[acyl-carrier-protein]-phospholipid O-acyltransferase/long-chain-fatty-acid--[acyl-carrier-protein] ligase